MSRQVRKAEQFIADFDGQFRWYGSKLNGPSDRAR